MAEGLVPHRRQNHLLRRGQAQVKDPVLDVQEPQDAWQLDPEVEQARSHPHPHRRPEQAQTEETVQLRTLSTQVVEGQ